MTLHLIAGVMNRQNNVCFPCLLMSKKEISSFLSYSKTYEWPINEKCKKALIYLIYEIIGFQNCKPLFFMVFSNTYSLVAYPPSSLHPGPIQGSKSWVCGQGTLRSNWAFSILCLIRLPFSQVAELQADHGDQLE